MPYTMPGAMATVTASLFKRIPLKPDAGPGLNSVKNSGCPAVGCVLRNLTMV